jgi:hypothetical protein
MGMADDKLERMFNDLESLAGEVGLVVVRVKHGIEIYNKETCRTFDGIKEGVMYVTGFSDAYFS